MGYASLHPLKTVVNMVVNECPLCVGDGAFHRLKLLGQIKAGSPGLAHLARCPAALDAFDDIGVALVQTLIWHARSYPLEGIRQCGRREIASPRVPSTGSVEARAGHGLPHALLRAGREQFIGHAPSRLCSPQIGACPHGMVS